MAALSSAGSFLASASSLDGNRNSSAITTHPKGNQKDEIRRVGAEKRAVKGV